MDKITLAQKRLVAQEEKRKQEQAKRLESARAYLNQAAKQQNEARGEYRICRKCGI